MSSRLFDYLRCLRGSRGFGVHSPFAFEFILNVLRDRHPFYAYDTIRELRNQTPRGLRPPQWLARLMFRISSRLDYRPIVVLGDLDPVLTRTLTLPSSRMSITANPSEAKALYVIADNYTSQPPALARLITDIVTDEGSAIVMGHIEAIRMLTTLLPHGMVFTDNRHLSVIVGYRHLPVKKYLTRFS